MAIWILVFSVIIAALAQHTFPIIAGLLVTLFIMVVNKNNAVEDIDELKSAIQALTDRLSAYESGGKGDEKESLRKKLDALEQKVVILEYRVSKLTPGDAKAVAKEKVEIPAEPSPPPSPTPVEISKPKPAEPKPAEPPKPQTAIPSIAKTRDSVPPLRVKQLDEAPAKKEESEFQKKCRAIWEKLQQQFIENWTGILGSIILVMGVGFLGIYTALKVVPFYRFIMLVLFSSILTGLFFFLKSKPKWLRLGLWLRSSAAAIFLFACLGAWTIDGLKWITGQSQELGLGLLAAGIGVNLLLAVIGGKQVFASLHVLLSLVALAVAPPSMLTLIVATVVTLMGVALTYREKWEYHLMLSISLFFGYHLYWYFQTLTLELSRTQHLVAILSISAVGIVALLVHYRALYATEKFAKLPFFVHFMNWLYFATGLYLHSTGSAWKSIVLGIGAVGAFFLARQARKLRIRWLYLTDTLVAQAIALFALFSLNRLSVDPFLTVVMMLVETLLFLTVMSVEGEKLLCKIGTILKYILALILIVWGHSLLYTVSSLTASASRWTMGLGLCVILATLLHLYLLRIQKKGDQDTDATGTKQFTWMFAALYFIHLFYAAFATYLYRSRWQWRPLLIASLAVVAYLVARRAKTITPRLIYQTGTLIAPAIAITAIWSLSQYHVESYFRLGLIFILLSIFTVLMIKEDQELLRNIGGWALAGFSAILVFAGLRNPYFTATTVLYKHAATLLACLTWGTLFHAYSQKKSGEAFCAFHIQSPNHTTRYFSFIGMIPGIFLATAFSLIYPRPGSGYLYAAIVILLLFIARKIKSNGLGIGLIISIIPFYSYSLKALQNLSNDPLLTKSIYCIPLLVVPLAFIFRPCIPWLKRTMKAFGIYLFYLQLLWVSYYLFTKISPFIAGALWLLMSIITLETVIRLRRYSQNQLSEKGEPDRYVLHMGYLLLAAFTVRHIGVHLLTATQINGFPIRVAISIFALLTLIYWALRQVPQMPERHTIHDAVHPLFLEFIFAFSILTIVVEIHARWFPIIWIVAAIVTLLKGRSLTGETSRLRFYSLLLYLASTVYVALVPALGLSAGNGSSWYKTSWVIDSAAILMQFVYIILIRQLPFLKDVTFPKLLEPLKQVTDSIERSKNPWIYYPLFFSVAIFLYFTFDRAILTLLWVMECFAVFITAVVLKENHFRYLAMAGLALSVVRLIFYDLAKSDTFMRALVFIGVGALMLIMNSLYNKYRNRF